MVEAKRFAYFICSRFFMSRRIRRQERGYCMYDVIVIGGGVTGCAIARELSKFEGKGCVIEAGDDVCSGTSKANSAIIHAGFDAAPGSNKARLNVRGNAMMDELAEKLDISFRRNGSLVVRTAEQPEEGLRQLLEKGRQNGVPGIRIVAGEELRAMEPNLADTVVEALYAPTGAIVCPFEMTIAFAENAYENGMEFRLETTVKEIEKEEGGYCVRVEKRAADQMVTTEELHTKAVVNAAGVYADVWNNRVSENKIHITARKGEYLLLDKVAGDHVQHTVFQLPGKMGKGVLVTQTVHDNLLVGPTAKDIDDKEGVNTTPEGLEYLPESAATSVKNLPLRQVITSFAGLRAHEDGDDFVLGEVADAPNFYNAAGIESPGLSSAPAIGEEIAAEVAAKLGLQKKEGFKDTRKGVQHLAELSMEQRNELIRQNPAYGNIICRCEMISEGEILDAIHRPIGARSLDAVKRRTRAGMGRCQSGFCSPRVIDILNRECGIPMEQVRKNSGASNFIVGKNKEI